MADQEVRLPCVIATDLGNRPSQAMALKFGTSGLRGLVTEMTDQECYLYARAFTQYVKSVAPARIASLAGDLRPSTPRILRAVSLGLDSEGMQIDYCGTISTPALTYHAMQNANPSLMVTGSHIPADRNGMKFNMPWGEVLKADEELISKNFLDLKQQVSQGLLPFPRSGSPDPGTSPLLPELNEKAEEEYTRRYLDFFPPDSLRGLRVIVYEHSSVSRDLLPLILEALGAEVIKEGRSEEFVPVDTEAVENPEKLTAWVHQHKADALVSTDGDGDRPLFFDETGRQVRGDVLGILVADFLGSDAVSIPVSCSSATERSRYFRQVVRTRIGSPFVILSMKKALEDGHRRVVGFEANGGFLTAGDLVNPDTNTVLKALPTRDAVLPIVAALRRSVVKSKTISGQVAELPPIFTSSGVIKAFPRELGQSIVSALEDQGFALVSRFFGEAFGKPLSLNVTDGVRITFSSGDVVHLRPSGNAPEFRCYTESSHEEIAVKNNQKALMIIQQVVRPLFEAK